MNTNPYFLEAAIVSLFKEYQVATQDHENALVMIKCEPVGEGHIRITNLDIAGANIPAGTLLHLIARRIAEDRGNDSGGIVDGMITSIVNLLLADPSVTMGLNGENLTPDLISDTRHKMIHAMRKALRSAKIQARAMVEATK